jgi:hypothetical protein
LKTTFDIRTASIRLTDDLFRINIKEDAEVGLDDAVEIAKIATELTQNTSVIVLADARLHCSITSEARKYFAEHSVKNRFTAVAVLSDSLPVRILLNFYVNIDRPDVPTKLFSNETEALEWLNSFRK